MSKLKGTEEYLAAKIPVLDVTDPESPVRSIYDWVAGGYADDERTDDEAIRVCYLSVRHLNSGAYAEILVGGVPVLANQVPFYVKEAHPELVILTFNWPEIAGNYSCVIDSWRSSLKLDRAKIEWQEVLQ